MSQNFILKECVKCSAPLKRIGDELVCEYCGSRYDLPEDYRKRKLESEKPELKPDLIKTSNELPVKSGQKQNKQSCGVILLRLILVVIAGAIVFWIFRNLGGVINKEPITEESQFKSAVRVDPYGKPDENPADFIFETNFYLGAVLNQSDNDYFRLDVYFKNRTDATIDGNSKSNHLQMKSVNISDNLGKVYACKFSSEVSTLESIDPGEITRLSSISCEDGLTPEVKYLDVNIETVHWGSFDFQVSVLPSLERLRIKYDLERYEEDFLLEISFYSEPPQHISLYFDDISVIDSKGNVYLPNYTGDFWNDDMKFFTSLVHGFSGDNKILLKFGRPFPDDANSVTVAITINGQTITTTAPVDTIEGNINFSHEPEE